MDRVPLSTALKLTWLLPSSRVMSCLQMTSWGLRACCRLDYQLESSHCAPCGLAGLQQEAGDEVGSIAVLTPYKAQLELLKSRCSRLAPRAEFSTVDGFQVGYTSFACHASSSSFCAQACWAVCTGCSESHPAGLAMDWSANGAALHAASLSCITHSAKHQALTSCDAQGKEADHVIFSCVRAHSAEASSSIGFLADVRRMNVGLTRGR